MKDVPLDGKTNNSTHGNRSVCIPGPTIKMRLYPTSRCLFKNHLPPEASSLIFWSLHFYTKSSIQWPKLAKLVCFTDFTCADCRTPPTPSRPTPLPLPMDHPRGNVTGEGDLLWGGVWVGVSKKLSALMCPVPPRGALPTGMPLLGPGPVVLQSPKSRALVVFDCQRDNSYLLPVLEWNPLMIFLEDLTLSQTTQCWAVPWGHYLTLNYYYYYD